MKMERSQKHSQEIAQELANPSTNSNSSTAVSRTCTHVYRLTVVSHALSHALPMIEINTSQGTVAGYYQVCPVYAT